MAKHGFSKLTSTQKRLYGPRALLLSGFAAGAQSKFITLLAMLGLKDLPLVWASDDQADESLQSLFQHENGFGEGKDSSLPRSIIAGGIMEKELHQLMSGCRNAGMKQALWATLTPTSEAWPLERLLTELQSERQALSARKKRPGR